jgi:hypothetical protein
MTVCSVAVIGLVGLLVLRHELQSNCCDQHQAGAWDGDYADIPFPGRDVKGVERLEQWRDLSNGACGANGVKTLALQFKTKATPDAVARAYAGGRTSQRSTKLAWRGFSD